MRTISLSIIASLESYQYAFYYNLQIANFSRLDTSHEFFQYALVNTGQVRSSSYALFKRIIKHLYIFTIYFRDHVLCVTIVIF